MQGLHPYNEKELLLQIANGSEQAFAELFNTYRPKLYTNIYKLTDSREAAEDTVHEVFLKIWAQRELLTTIEHFGAYISRMAQNYAYSGFRRMSKETLILAEIKREQTNDDSFHPAKQMMAKEVRDFIHEAVAKLTPQQKLVFLLSREEGLKHEEIAQRLNISILTVKKHIGHALRFLREEIGRSYGSYAVAIYILYHLYAN